MDNPQLSRKERLEQWRTRKGEGAGVKANSRSKRNGHVASNPVGRGALAERSNAPNSVNVGLAPPVLKHQAKRKPFHVDIAGAKEAGERRVAPGTPINMLRKRLRRVAPAAAAVNSPKQRTRSMQQKSSSELQFVSRRIEQATKPHTRSKTVGPRGHANVSKGKMGRTLEEARMGHVSDHLKRQIGEAHMLVEVSGVEAARTLLGEMLLSGTGMEKAAADLALYWAARAKLEEDAGLYTAARRILDEGQAYLSAPTQRKVMEKVVAAFESRMDEREEANVRELLEESMEDEDNSPPDDSHSPDDAHSPTPSTTFRYDPKELSVEDGDVSSASAIKNLNFSRIAGSESSESMASNTPRAGEGSSGSSSGRSSSSAGACGGDLSTVPSARAEQHSDHEESDVSISDIDEAVLARAKALTDKEHVVKAEAQNQESPELVYASVASAYQAKYHYSGRSPAETQGQEEEEDRMMGVGANTVILAKVERSSSSMPPPEARRPNLDSTRARRGTPYPQQKQKPKQKAKEVMQQEIPTNHSSSSMSSGSFFLEVESKESKASKVGERTSLTPVRRSRRLSSCTKTLAHSHVPLPRGKVEDSVLP